MVLRQDDLIVDVEQMAGEPSVSLAMSETIRKCLQVARYK